jgi:hypothetical protein
MDGLLNVLSGSKLFNGCIMLLTNIGGRYISMELPSNVEKLFSGYTIMRYLVLFSVFFMATRDIKTSILLLLFFLIIVKYFMNEKSSFCVLENKNEITEEQYKKALEMIQEYEMRNNT